MKYIVKSNTISVVALLLFGYSGSVFAYGTGSSYAGQVSQPSQAMINLSSTKESQPKSEEASQAASMRASRQRAFRSGLPTVYVPPSLENIAVPAAVNQGPGSIQDALDLIKKGDMTKDTTYYKQSLGILQRIQQLPVFPSSKYSEADFYDLMGYATQMLAKTRSEYMTAEGFYHKALLINPSHIQANKNMGKLNTDLFRLTGRESFLDKAEHFEEKLLIINKAVANALRALQDDINSFSAAPDEAPTKDGDADSNWYASLGINF